jgi:hypothetical protein
MQAQQNVRKLAISTKQTIECAAKQIVKSGPKSATAPFQVSLQTPAGSYIGGVSIVWFWYTYLKNTQVSIEVARAMQFRRLNDTNLDGYQLCLKGKNTSMCVLNNANLTNIATFNVTDHTCDIGVLSKI